MKTTLLAIAMIFITAVTASAFELGYGFQGNADVTIEYNITQDIFTSDATVGVSYDLNKVNLYADVNWDLVNQGAPILELGANLDVNKNVDVGLKSTVDQTGNFGDVILTTTLSF